MNTKERKPGPKRDFHRENGRAFPEVAWQKIQSGRKIVFFDNRKGKALATTPVAYALDMHNGSYKLHKQDGELIDEKVTTIKRCCELVRNRLI